MPIASIKPKIIGLVLPGRPIQFFLQGTYSARLVERQGRLSTHALHNSRPHCFSLFLCLERPTSGFDSFNFCCLVPGTIKNDPPRVPLILRCSNCHSINRIAFIERLMDGPYLAKGLINFNLDSTVLGATRCGLVIRDRFGFAESLARDPTALHTLLHHVIPNRHPTPVR
jgi:hypothetical protein